jgi:hypothetical protein
LNESDNKPLHLQAVQARGIVFDEAIFRTDVPSVMTQSVRQEHGTSRISSKAGAVCDVPQEVANTTITRNTLDTVSHAVKSLSLTFGEYDFHGLCYSLIIMV